MISKAECLDSKVGTVTGYGLKDRGLMPGRGKIILFSKASRQALEPTQPLIQWVPAAIYLGVKRPRSEADQFSPFSAAVKNAGAIPPLPICLHGIVLN
jgi:hypothetical protein